MTSPNEYVNKFLELVPELTKVSSPYGPYRGFSLGTRVFQRKDKNPINDLDLAQLKKLSFGQVHEVRGIPGDMTCSVYFECDSTD